MLIVARETADRRAIAPVALVSRSIVQIMAKRGVDFRFLWDVARDAAVISGARDSQAHKLFHERKRLFIVALANHELGDKLLRLLETLEESFAAKVGFRAEAVPDMALAGVRLPVERDQRIMALAFMEPRGEDGHNER